MGVKKNKVGRKKPFRTKVTRRGIKEGKNKRQHTAASPPKGETWENTQREEGEGNTLQTGNKPHVIQKRGK